MFLDEEKEAVLESLFEQGLEKSNASQPSQLPGSNLLPSKAFLMKLILAFSLVFRHGVVESNSLVSRHNPCR